MRPIARIFSSVLLPAALAASCSRSVSYDTDLQLKPLVQFTSGGPILPLEGTVSYAFPLADTTRWTVATYRDALDGVLTERFTGERLTGGVRGSSLAADGRQTWLSMPVSATSALITAADPAQRQYGYAQIELAENLSPLTVAVVFYPWTQAATYKKGVWWMFNEEYVSPEESPLLIVPEVRETEGGETAPLSGSKVFAFPGFDPALWLPATYADASQGILTRIGTKQTYSNGIAGRALSDEQRSTWLGLDVKETSLVVAVDTKNKLYAYAQLTPERDLAPREVEVVFDVWRYMASYPSGVWTVIDESYVAPETMLLQLDPRVQHEQEGPTEPLAGVVAYAFANLDPAEWVPASYEDAVKGILTKEGTDQTRENGTPGRHFTAEGEEYRIGIPTASSQQSLVLAVDTEHKLYAYAVLQSGTDGQPASFEVVFQRWQTEAEYMSGDWIVVDEFTQPGGETSSRKPKRTHDPRP